MINDGYSIPKPLLPIMGVPNIERTILMLHEFGIREIIIICSSEHLSKFTYLQDIYGCTIVHSLKHYNALYSMSHVVTKIDDTFVIEGDVVLAKNIFVNSKNSFYYTVTYTNCEKDAWHPILDGNRINKFEIGCFTKPCIFGISFWSHHDSPIVQSILREYFTTENFKNRNLFWDDCIAAALDRLYIGTYEIAPTDACEMNTGEEYKLAQELCMRYYHNCENFILDYNWETKLQPELIELAYVQDVTSCQRWHQRLLTYVNARCCDKPANPEPLVFTEGEHPFMVMNVKTGSYIAYFDIAESNDYLLLRRIFVDKMFRRRGIGGRIVNYIRLFAKLANKEMRVNVYEKEAEQFYVALGMQLYFKTFRFSEEDL